MPITDVALVPQAPSKIATKMDAIIVQPVKFHKAEPTFVEHVPADKLQTPPAMTVNVKPINIWTPPALAKTAVRGKFPTANWMAVIHVRQA